MKKKKKNEHIINFKANCKLRTNDLMNIVLFRSVQAAK